MRLPDFIIIGAMKCATSTLHSQLAVQPGIFMSEPKEPNFFSDNGVYARGVDWYGSLFAEAAPSDLAGESSTHYTKLPTYSRAVERLAEAMPAPKLIYMMRHPVERLISHYMHDWSEGKISCGIDEAIDRHPELIDYGRYAYQLQPYLERFGTAAILPVFMPRLKAEPQAELERICSFIGYNGAPRWRDDLEPQNVSRDRVRRFPLYGALVESGWATWLRRVLVPKPLRNFIRSKLQMHERPELPNERRTGVEKIFDEDLEILGAWYGCELTCSNFNKLSADLRLG